VGVHTGYDRTWSGDTCPLGSEIE